MVPALVGDAAARTYARPGYRGVQPFQSPLTVVFAAISMATGPTDHGRLGGRTYTSMRRQPVGTRCWAHTRPVAPRSTSTATASESGDCLYTYPVVYSPAGTIGGWWGWLWGTSAVAAGD